MRVLLIRPPARHTVESEVPEAVEAENLSYPPLSLLAIASFLLFERSKGGLFMMALLALIGPAAEVGLINWLHLYAYTHADAAGIPSWIPWVYAAGGPANGAAAPRNPGASTRSA